MPQIQNEPLASIAAARRLHDAGLEWRPHEGDRFHIPDRDLDDDIWTVSDMVVEARNNIMGQRELAFNGTVEWALDSIVKDEVIWVPSEGQLRELLAAEFIALYREDDGRHSCVARVDNVPVTFSAATAADAYAAALLALIDDSSS